ncbi:MAG: HEAT repeat domain-containing protein [candidate division Zixibacteria bacterium]|nr:HEAT repeat domain-containing protein [candidate division Zixibacteria bacterium]
MKRFLKSILGGSFDIRKGEWTLTLLMFANIYLILVTYYLLKPARDSLFLVKVSPLELPIVFIIIALVTVPVITLYSKLGRTLKLHKLINLTTVILIINILILRWLIERDDPWIYYLFYIWVSIYGVLVTSQFWLFANSIFDAAQAKRIFVFLALGGIIGAITGGQVTKLIVSYFGVSTENLLFFCIGFLAITIVLVSVIWEIRIQQGKEPSPRKKKSGGESKESFAMMVGTLKGSKHLKLIVSILATTVLVAAIVDYQFKFIVFESIPEKDKLTPFFGDFYTWLSVASLGMQGLFTNRFLRKLGVGGAILFLPIGLLLGGVTMVIMPGLAAAVFFRGSDGAMRYSIDKTGKELLFMPVPLEVKKRLKIFIDIFVDRLFRGIAGGLLLLCIYLNFSIVQITYLVMAFIAVWIVIALIMRKEYVNTFRRALEERRIDPAELRFNVDDAQSLNALIAALGSTNEKHVNYALTMLTSVREKGLKWPIKPLLQHQSDEVKINALIVLQNLGDESDIAEVEPLLKDENIDIRSRAINFIARHSNRDDKEILKEHLESPDKNVSEAALACIVEFGSPLEIELITDAVIEKMIDQHGEEALSGRLEVAKALGVIESADLNKYLRTLLNDSSAAVVAETINSIGRQQVREYVPWLINKLSDRDSRVHCRNSLAAFGTKVLGTLNDYLNDEQLSTTMRKHIPRVMAEIPHQDTINLLTNSLEAQSSWLAYDILKALNRLRINHSNLKFNDREIDSTVINETRSFYEVLQILQLQNGHDKPECVLLKNSLEERLDANLEQIFRLMGLRYPPDDIYSAYLGVVSKHRKVRANAIEFLDNLLKADMKRYILPIIDEVSADFTAQKGRDLFRFELDSEEEGLCCLINGSNVWLKVCAIYNVPRLKTDKLVDLVKDMQNDKDPMVRETVKLVLEKIES